MQESSFSEAYPSKLGDQPPAYTPGPSVAPVMQPAPYPAYYPPMQDRSVQQTLICQQPSTNVVVVNNNGGQVVPIQPRHKDYLCWSIMNMLCCCCPLGVAAIVFSCMTRSDNDARDQEAAAKNSRRAFTLNIAALVIGLLLEVSGLILYFVVLHSAVSGYRSSDYGGNYGRSNYGY
ncbi:proline rich transmembrane protein 1B-like [Dendropsophus ebraccatus]|uniref:proline rich transmembrane protein 1B-like n=1 Tax=Dendropsophus ebraccatus TaxID=150705 RepID=UPI0038316AB5